MIPKPLILSNPGDSTSNAVLVKIVLNCAGVSEGFADFRTAAIAPAFGAAADVPKNTGSGKVSSAIVTPSAAVISGLLRTTPPLLLKSTLPGVTAEPSAL